MIKTTVFVFMMTLTIGMLVGCDTGNPICTDSFCLVPRDDVTGDVIEIDDAKLLALIGKETAEEITPVVPTPLPITPDPPASISLAQIFADVESNGVNSTFIGQTVTVTGIVVWKHDNGTAIVISQDGEAHDTVDIFITSLEDASHLDGYTKGTEYTFTLSIDRVQISNKDTDRFYLWTTLDD